MHSAHYSKPKSSDILFKDPVCGKHINRGKAHITIEHKGINHFLCCPQCQTQFERSPKSYAKPELGEKARKIQHYPVKQHN